MKTMKGDVYLITPLDFSILCEHLGSCLHTRRRWPSLQDMTQAMHGFVSTRFVTTVGIIALLLGAAIWLA